MNEKKKQTVIIYEEEIIPISNKCLPSDSHFHYIRSQMVAPNTRTANFSQLSTEEERAIDKKGNK